MQATVFAPVPIQAFLAHPLSERGYTQVFDVERKDFTRFPDRWREIRRVLPSLAEKKALDKGLVSVSARCMTYDVERTNGREKLTLQKKINLCRDTDGISKEVPYTQ